MKQNQGTGSVTTKESRLDMRYKSFEMALRVIEKEQRLVYDASMLSDQSVEYAIKNKNPIKLDCKGRGIQNAAFTYSGITTEAVIEAAEKIYQFLICAT